MSKGKVILIIFICLVTAAVAAGIVAAMVEKSDSAQNKDAKQSVSQTNEVITQYTTGKSSHEKIRVACVGDSITYGYGLYNRDTDSYPAVLQQLLGDKYEVINFGLSGRTATLSGDKPYALEDYFEQSKSFSPHIVLLMLGTNDTKKINWNRAQFVNDYRYLINTYSSLPEQPQVYVMLPPPLFDMQEKDTYPNEAVLKLQTIPLLKVIAKQKDLPVINLYQEFENKPYLLSDGCHPNEVGAEAIAKLVYNAITK